MLMKPRVLSDELSILRCLNIRMDLSSKDKRHLLKLEKGYQGEVMFDQLTEKLQSKIYILNDLCLEFNRSIFQIDTLIISESVIFPLDVKNYEGDYIYGEEEFQRVMSDHKMPNPLNQLKRSHLLLRSLLKSLNIHLDIDGSIIFINPKFTLYQAPVNPSFIFPTQINLFLKTLNEIPSNLNDHHKRIADLLISMHQPESPFIRLPPYEYNQLRKGIICEACHSFHFKVSERKLVCNQCGRVENIDSAVLRNVEEFRLLFPNRKIRTNCIHEWCNIISSKKKIRRILSQNLRPIGEREHRYFV
ncbi:nuclease-related domain-containing protein [Bacillus sp. FJAT-50079]|uniref:nuclease-related domain-containing protein n=1 Tax=Bacillus sp. FJAT-50079 TaxID=2833577 RepID=UPI001BC94C18|nr:nuclease-related domain-containing protein [Bacillus sp. FJAT-50079]MBS4210608.1 NERD domain-containing protein [Bacillus sp. FJAT-50079]